MLTALKVEVFRIIGTQKTTPNCGLNFSRVLASASTHLRNGNIMSS